MNQQYFTDDEWVMLLQAPQKAVSALVLADKTDPVSFLNEVQAAIQILQTEQNQDWSNDLVKSLTQSMREFDAQDPLQGDQLLLKRQFEFLAGLKEYKSAVEGRTSALEHLKQVSSILAAKVTANQAVEFKQWLLTLTTKVAEAVKENTFLGGIGGERISSAEAAMLSKIEEALNSK
jgi:hypothetical protein